MKINSLFFIILLSYFLSGYMIIQDQDWVAPAEADKLDNPFSGNVKATAKGGKIYKKLCWSCHGATGTGNGPAAVALNPVPTNYAEEHVQQQTDGALYWKITNGRGTMASYKTVLSEDQRWMLVNYIRALAKQGDGSALKTPG